MRYYFGWQIDMSNTQKSISQALQRYYDKFGFPPRLILVSDKLEEIPVPVDMKLVVKVHRVPKNILLIGDKEENDNK